MFERYTDRARRVVVLAQEEARLLDHSYIGTEHLLLGLIHENDGVAAAALKSLGITFNGLRQQVEEIIVRGQQAPSGHIPFTPRTKKVLELSLRVSLQLGHNYIGTEHILLGLIQEGEGAAAQALVKIGISLNVLRERILQLLAHDQRTEADVVPTNKEVAEGNSIDSAESPEKIPPVPAEILQMLDQRIVGQTHAKRILAVAAYNHYKRIARWLDPESSSECIVRPRKSNILMLGPTGCGKTHLARTLADLLDVPFAIADATTLTPYGWVGDDVRTIVEKLKSAADGDTKRAATGIIYIDEIDKIAAHAKAARDTSEPLGEKVQHALLNMLEGSKISGVDTTNVLFIGGGAFIGIDDIVRQRMNGRKRLRWRWSRTSAGIHNGYNAVLPEDLRMFGLIPEFVGRFPIAVGLAPFGKELLMKVLTEPRDSLVREYKYLLEADGVNLQFTNEALEAIAERAARLQTGARSLRSIMEQVLMPHMFDLPSCKGVTELVVTAETVQANLKDNLDGQRIFWRGGR